MITDTAVARIERYAREKQNHHEQTKSTVNNAAYPPFFMAVGLHKPHIPWVMPQRFLDAQLPLNETDVAARDVPPENYCNASLYVCDNLYKGLPWEPGPKADQQDHRRKYRAATTWTDFNVGRLLTALDKHGLHDDTAVVFHGDHGWHLGEHGVWCKQSNFDLVARVPLIVYVPWLAASHGQSTSALVEIVDLFPTTLDLFNITARVPDAAQLEGFSFLPLLEQPATAASSWKNVTFTQYPRCAGTGKGPGVGRMPWEFPTNNPCTQVASGAFDVMGYTARSDRWRYTVWLKWDGKALKVKGWAGDNVVGEELYDHQGDDGMDTDDDETVNLGCAAAPHARVCAAHKASIVAGWKHALPRS